MRFFHRLIPLLLLAAAPVILEAQATSSIAADWPAGVLDLILEYDIDSFTPAERSRIQGEAERAKTDAFLAAAAQLQIDSSTRLIDWIDANARRLPDLTARLDAVPLAASSFDREFGRLRFRYEIPLYPDLAAPFLDHRRGYDLPPTLFFTPSAPFSGILIYAGGEFPVRGENREALLEPALLPRVWDTEMNLIFEPGMIDRDILLERGPVRYSRDLASQAVRDRVGPNPVRILARELFGITPTDPVIPREDALMILNSPAGNRLLREGRIVIVY